MPGSAVAPAHRGMEPWDSVKIPKLPWLIAILLLLSTAINYADRLTLSIVSRVVRGELGMSEQQYSYVGTAFLAAYAIMYASSGYIVDRLGPRIGFAVFMLAWSAAQMLHAAVQGVWSLGAARFLLGLAEPGAWPAAAKAIAEWFPARQRALGMGMFNAGTSIGSAIAPPLVATVAALWGWRYAFVVTGAMGLVWLALWLLFYDAPERNRWLREQDRPERAAVKPAEAHAAPDWREVIRQRGCYTLILARFFTDPVIYFVIFWLPEYLGKERGFNLQEIGRYSAVPFIFGGIGYILGGWLSGRLMQAGWPLPRARKAVMAAGAALMPAAIIAPLVPSAGLAIVCICFVTFGHAFWVANLQTLPTDLFRSREIGSASGFTGMGGAIGGALANLGTGWVVSHYSYAPVFAAAGLMHPLSAVLVYRMLPDRLFGIAPQPETAREPER